MRPGPDDPSASRRDLQNMLDSFESGGELSDEGSFTLNPERAVEILRGQGRLGQNAPLHLLSAIYTHTGGALIHRQQRNHRWSLRWASSQGPLPASVERLLAQESFATHGIELDFEPDAVLLTARKGVAGLILEPLFAQVADRLRYYPWAVARPKETPLLEHRGPGCLLWLCQAQDGHGRFWHLLRGIAYPRRGSLPVNVVCWDEWGRPDLTLSTIPDSTRKTELETLAERCFVDLLVASLPRQPRVCTLSPYDTTQQLPLYAVYLAFSLAQRLDKELAREAGARVAFLDVNDRLWSAAELQAVYQREGRLLVVPSLPAPERLEARPDRPVLLWGGQAESIGTVLFPNVTSGAGYLYSLAVNKKERQLVEHATARLASTQVESGRLSLLPWGEPDRVAEVEFVGPRRARETFYLEPDAPRGLRLLWESEFSLEETLRELSLEQPLRQAVLELIDSALADEQPARETLLTALAWALSNGEVCWERLPRLADLPLLESVPNTLISVRGAMECEKERGSLPVLFDRSVSLPSHLPLRPILWWHPLLESLGLRTEDAGRLVREAHWQEQGRERWLAARAPSEPSWPTPARTFGPHRVGPAPRPEDLTEVAFWREGRPFGRRLLANQECPPGWRVLWQEDDLPADIYWSGPDPTALRDRIPLIAELCRSYEETGQRR